ncbi:MAG: tryptophan synthase subunit alpha [Pseudomonadota bacterium]|jgi:tryptophan synthase alpha chain
MSRISPVLAALAASGRKALIPYVTAGDPSPASTVELLHALVKAGADVIELGIPFSDPMADGPVIQRASERALAHGVSLTDCLGWVAEFRRSNPSTPIVLMGYANPIERMGQQAFVQAAATAGVDGVLVVDYPPEECEPFAQALQAAQIDPIFLLAPTSSTSRMDQVARLGGGYLYYVSLKGVTGAASLDVASVAQRVATLRQHAKLPVGVGFGISDAASAVAVAEHADAVVIGSAIIKLMESQAQAGSSESSAAVKAAGEFLGNIREALDARFGGKASA